MRGRMDCNRCGVWQVERDMSTHKSDKMNDTVSDTPSANLTYPLKIGFPKRKVTSQITIFQWPTVRFRERVPSGKLTNCHGKSPHLHLAWPKRPHFCRVFQASKASKFHPTPPKGYRLPKGPRTLCFCQPMKMLGTGSVSCKSQNPKFDTTELSIHPSIHWIWERTIKLSIYPSIHPSIHLSIYLSIYPSIHLSIHLSIHPSIYSSFYLFCLSICQSLCLFVSILGRMMPCWIDGFSPLL